MRIVYAISTSTVGLGGQLARIVVGEPWDADDPVVKAHPDLFEKKPRMARTSKMATPWVETATAVPGASRNARR